jgi:hypothetical protein
MRPLLIAIVSLALATPAAHAQSSPFGPLPEPVQPVVTPEPTPDPLADQGTVSRPLLFGIAGGVLVLFVGIGLYISRDARRHLTDHDRRAVEHERERTEAQRLRGDKVKKKAREKTRAQKQARKRQRSRR